MAIPGSLFYRSPALQVIYVLCVLADLVPDAGGRRHHQIQIQPACPTFTCGAHLRNVSYPFRRRGDPPECGVASYELTCTDDKAIIQIDNGTYLVRGINCTDATFSVVDANMLDSSNSTCPLPRWNRIPYYYRRYGVVEDSSRNIVQELAPSYSIITAAFVTCSREVTNNGMYMPVACLSTNSSFVYVLTGWFADFYIKNLEPSCGYLAMTPLSIGGLPVRALNASYADVVKLMRGGFAIQFPYKIDRFDYCKLKDFMAQSFQ